MIAPWVLIAVVAGIVLAFWYSRRKPGFRGSIGCKNQNSAEIVLARIDGFSRVVQCHPLKPGEHSFSYLGRLDIPDQVSITWKLAADAEERRASVSLRDVPRVAPGESGVFFVLGADGVWRAEYTPDLLASLQPPGDK